MNVLIASNDQNPYIKELCLALNQSVVITQSVDHFFNTNLNFDLIHIQWIEELCAWQLPDQSWLEQAENCLKKWKTKSKIIITRHNVLPNLPNQLLFEPLYQMFYSYADAIIHLGAYSIKEFKVRYQNLFPQIKHELIYHHVYESYPNEVNQFTAKQCLNIKQKNLVQLSFGKVRVTEEKQLIKKAFGYIEAENKTLIAPKWLYSSVRKGKLDQILHQISYLFNKNFRGMILSDQHLSPNDVQYYFKACDFVFNQRIYNLNSGVLFLALAFHTKILCPAVGNMTEVLAQLGLPNYTLEDPNSIKIGLKKIIALTTKDMDLISEKATRLFSLEKAVLKHISLYRSLIN